jgi:hypothetical protein
MITPERKKLIDAATPENPVNLTREEEVEMRTLNRTRFYHDVGTGRFRVKARPGSSADTILKLKNQGLSNSEIANELGIDIDESAIERTSQRVYTD